MNNLRELLREGDPLRNEPARHRDQRDLRRQTVLAAARRDGASATPATRLRMVFVAVAVFVVIALALLGALVWSPFIGNVHAAIRFEVRLAEEKPAPGLREAKISDSGRSVYLHDEVIVTNSDIAGAQVVQAGEPLQYAVRIQFTAGGAEKMRAATGKHIGQPLAILLDDQVIMAPAVRSPIGPSAEITGRFTKTQAGRIVKGIKIH